MIGPWFHRAVVVVALAILMATGTASADAKTARADQLFEEGKAMLDKDLAGACAKFDESLKFNAQAIGTLLNVALCDERLGRYASAVAKFIEARDRAKEQNLDVHVAAAEEHLRALRVKVPHVTFKFSQPPLPETTIVIDENLIPFDSIANYQVDPGPHDVVVEAPGHLAYKAHFDLAVGKDIDLRVPSLEKSVSVKSSRRTIGKITTASGAAALGTGIVLAVIAKRNYDDATKSCNRIPYFGDTIWQCDQDGFAATRSARNLGTIATVVGGLGLAAIGVGTFLWLRGPRDSDERISLVPHVGPEGAGIAAEHHVYRIEQIHRQVPIVEPARPSRRVDAADEFRCIPNHVGGGSQSSAMTGIEHA